MWFSLFHCHLIHLTASQVTIFNFTNASVFFVPKVPHLHRLLSSAKISDKRDSMKQRTANGNKNTENLPPLVSVLQVLLCVLYVLLLLFIYHLNNKKDGCLATEFLCTNPRSYMTFTLCIVYSHRFISFL